MKRHALAIAIAAMALVVAGCAPATSTPSSTNEPTAADPQQGGAILTTQRYVLPGGLNFLTSKDQGLSGQITPSYSKLVNYVTGPDTVGIEIGPDLADSWDISDDGLVYTFHLNPNATFHDVPPVNGRKVNAEDVVATFNAIIEFGSPTAYQFSNVASIEALDEHTVEFTLTEPLSTMLENLATPGNFIAPIEGIRGEYDMDKVLIGSGPFVLVEYDPATIWERKRHPGYHKEGRPYADELNTLIVLDAAARFTALRSGQINHTIIAQQEQVKSLVDSGDFIAVSQPAGPEYIYLNQEFEPFRHLEVRRAIGMAIDWDSMGESIRGVYGLSSVVPPILGGLSEDELREVRPYDPDAAQELLAEAGYPDGFEVTMVVQQVDGNDVSEAEWIVEDLKAIGIDLTLELVDPATYGARRGGGQFQMARGLRTLLSADQFMAELQSESGTNFTKVNDPVLDDLIAQYRAELDPAARAEIAKEFTRYFETEVATVIGGPMTFDTWVWRADMNVSYTSESGLSPNVIRYGGMLEDIWFE
ncbi:MULTISPECIES: ABC transporter substrate-binding protein [unclassified Microbacterium]|uniref:ABC transporter substrate-binding protein n=1 Tax=unclassified Microbacterium TaxID=2609290 RepID=UPI00214BE26F|nr:MULTISPECIES: ABC transporter substrate-binding protein [unclassified Microbacterium]MCR2808391.1 ABC transporter substrate-binding protein [Microbacterium sp. zg.B185]WIM19163.1 ABC transporter substrate-binding protein [Microbacterium sp. zg-B185]